MRSRHWELIFLAHGVGICFVAHLNDARGASWAAAACLLCASICFGLSIYSATRHKP